MDLGSEFDKAILNAANDKQNNGRFNSWELCYQTFCDARKRKKSLLQKDYELLSLNLAFYLASWGMYRGSSFLLQKDYKVHINIIKEIMKDEYDSLLGLSVRSLDQNDNLEKIIELSNRIRNEYNNIRKTIRNNQNVISDILVTKVLLGTLACCPAYDEYLKIALKQENKTQQFGKKSIKQMPDIFNEIINSNHIATPKYPDMKIIDMTLWQYGIDINAK